MAKFKEFSVQKRSNNSSSMFTHLSSSVKTSEYYLVIGDDIFDFVHEGTGRGKRIPFFYVDFPYSRCVQYILVEGSGGYPKKTGAMSSVGTIIARYPIHHAPNQRGSFCCSVILQTYNRSNAPSSSFVSHNLKAHLPTNIGPSINKC